VSFQKIRSQKIVIASADAADRSHRLFADQ
jgi:hypothetical protein